MGEGNRPRITGNGAQEALLLLVDGHAYAYRAFHAIQRLSAPNGSPTNAIFGFIKMLTKLRQRLQPTHLAVVWDGGLDAGRLDVLPGYKAQRPPMPEALEAQIEQIKEYLAAAGYASLCREGIEADDWIATLARQAVEAGARVVIASSDKDFMQLVSDRVGLVNPNDKSETVWGVEQVRAKTGVNPPQIVEWLSLIGDSVDNIPGVEGVGPKTAADLLEQFGSVETLYQRLDDVTAQKMRENLQAAAQQVRRNRDLIRLKDDLPGEVTLDSLLVRAADAEALAALYRRWGFRSLLREVEGRAAGEAELFDMASAGSGRAGF
jgi:DNA polymerase-1